MFWKKKNNVNLYVRCSHDNARTAYRIAPDDHDSGVMLLIDGERVKIDNISANGVAFELRDACDPPPVSASRLQGILVIGDEQHPIPVELDVVVRQGDLVRCKIGNQNRLAQKKLAEAINNYQKQKIRAGEYCKDLGNAGQ